jgi:hypothetical protein
MMDDKKSFVKDKLNEIAEWDKKIRGQIVHFTGTYGSDSLMNTVKETFEEMRQKRVAVGNEIIEYERARGSDWQDNDFNANSNLYWELTKFFDKCIIDVKNKNKVARYGRQL